MGWRFFTQIFTTDDTRYTFRFFRKFGPDIANCKIFDPDATNTSVLPNVRLPETSLGTLFPTVRSPSLVTTSKMSRSTSESPPPFKTFELLGLIYSSLEVPSHLLPGQPRIPSLAYPEVFPQSEGDSCEHQSLHSLRHCSSNTKAESYDLQRLRRASRGIVSAIRAAIA